MATFTDKHIFWLGMLRVYELSPGSTTGPISNAGRSNCDQDQGALKHR